MTENTETCDRCEEPDDELQDGLDGEKVCPDCIMKEAERQQAEYEEEKMRQTVYRERGRWYVK